MIKNILAVVVLFLAASAANAQDGVFLLAVEKRLGIVPVIREGRNSTGLRLSEVCNLVGDPVAARVFKEYGAMFVASSAMTLPTRCVFSNDADVSRFQAIANPVTRTVGGVSITLQEPAMTALLAAVEEASRSKLRISPRGGSTGAKRSYKDTVDFWNSRFLPGLSYWTKRRRLTAGEAAEVRRMPINDQVRQVLEWEDRGIFFSKDLRKSILYSVAAPGASQHIFMLALDVEQFANARVRQILAKHGWFQTVKSDAPHFTYLGVSEDELPSLGLKAEIVAGQKYWIPDLR